MRSEFVRRLAERLDGPAAGRSCARAAHPGPSGAESGPTCPPHARAQREPAGQAGRRGARRQGGALSTRPRHVRRSLRHTAPRRRRRSRSGRGCHDAPFAQPRIFPMRSAWSPTRSMSFDTLFVVWPNCLLALPTLLATDWTSTFESARNRDPRGSSSGASGPSARARRRYPTAVAPTATAGPLTLRRGALDRSDDPAVPGSVLAGRAGGCELLLLLRRAGAAAARGRLLCPPRSIALLVAAFGRLARRKRLLELRCLDFGLGLGLRSGACWTWHESCPVHSVKPAGWPCSLPPRWRTCGVRQRLPKRPSTQPLAGILAPGAAHSLPQVLTTENRSKWVADPSAKSGIAAEPRRRTRARAQSRWTG